MRSRHTVPGTIAAHSVAALEREAVGVERSVLATGFVPPPPGAAAASPISPTAADRVELTQIAVPHWAPPRFAWAGHTQTATPSMQQSALAAPTENAATPIPSEPAAGPDLDGLVSAVVSVLDRRNRLDRERRGVQRWR